MGLIQGRCPDLSEMSSKYQVRDIDVIERACEVVNVLGILGFYAGQEAEQFPVGPCVVGEQRLQLTDGHGGSLRFNRERLGPLDS